jgi:hypothetical protein
MHTSPSQVCYHNMQNFADYGKLGHAEAVQLEIPESELPSFCQKYFELFGTRGYRHDPQDRGGEYRSVLGLPGGVDSPMFSVVEEAAAKSPGGMRLAKGRGDEPDTIGDKLVLVYDSNKLYALLLLPRRTRAAHARRHRCESLRSAGGSPHSASRHAP